MTGEGNINGCSRVIRRGGKFARCGKAYAKDRQCREHVEEYFSRVAARNEGGKRPMLWAVGCSRCDGEFDEGKGWVAAFRHPDGSGSDCHHRVCPEARCRYRVSTSLYHRSACGGDAVEMVGQAGPALFDHDDRDKPLPVCKRHRGVLRGIATRAANRTRIREERQQRFKDERARRFKDSDLFIDILNELGVHAERPQAHHADLGFIEVDAVAVIQKLGVTLPEKLPSGKASEPMTDV